MLFYRKKYFHFSFITSIVILIVFFSIQMFAQTRQAWSKKLNIAVMDFDARAGITKGEAASLSDIFSAQLVGTNEFAVVDRNRIKNILEEQGFQRSEVCSQVECFVEAGKILKVEKMFAGVVGKIGRIYTVNVQVIDISTGQIEINKSYNHDGDIEELAQEIIPKLATQMAEQLAGKADLQSNKWLWYVGGALVVGGGAAAYYFLKPGNKTGTTEPDLPKPLGLP